MYKQFTEVIDRIRKYIPCGLIFLCGLAFYSQLMSQQLVNSYDGIWEYTYHSAGKWELSLGRWFWLYLDKLRFGMNNDPWTSILAVGLFSAGMYVISDIFCLKSKPLSFLVSVLFISSTVVCVSLSYRFMSPVFGVAFLLSTLAAWVILKSRRLVLPVLLGGFTIALSMGTYQSYLGCTCVIIAGYLMWQLYCTDVSWKQLGVTLGKSVAALLLGAIMYILLLNIHLKIFHTALSSYNGANTYSIWNTIKKLPVTLKNAYLLFYMYFFRRLYKTNLLERYQIYLFVFAAAGIIFLIGLVQIWKKSRVRALCFLTLALVLPVACNAVALVATDVGTSIQMTAPLALLIPILVCVASQIKSSLRVSVLAQLAGLAVVLATLWGNIYQIQTDQNAMYEGRTASTAMAEEILHELAAQGCLDPDLRYCFIGIPAGNRLFYVSSTYIDANNYALVGVGWTDPQSAMKSWRGIFHYFCGVNLNVCPADACVDEIAAADVENMPAYPRPGYVKLSGDVVVVKVNE